MHAELLQLFGIRTFFFAELADLEAVMQWLHGGQNEIPANEASLKSIYLIGHSRGGAICAIKAAGSRFLEDLELSCSK